MTRLASLSLVALGLLSCGSTGGGLISLPLRAGGVDRDRAAPLVFTSPQGWTIALSTGLIALGPFYCNASPPRTDTFRSGLVLVQATGQLVVDVLDPALHELPRGADGETGRAVSVEIGLLPADQSQPAEARDRLAGDVGLIEGTATRAGVTVRFAGPIAIDASLATPQTPLASLTRIKGASADLSFSGGPQALELRVDPAGWFDGVDFGDLLLNPPRADGTYSWTVKSTFASALAQGVKRETGVYLFTLVPGS